MTAVHLQFWTSCRSCMYAQEYFGEEVHPLRDQTPVLKTPLEVVDGEMVVPQGPGLGVEVDEAVVVVVRRVGEVVDG